MCLLLSPARPGPLFQDEDLVCRSVRGWTGENESGTYSVRDVRERRRKMEKDRSESTGRPIRGLMANGSTCGCSEDGKEMHEAIFVKKSPVLGCG